jgi:UPF0042 nucleotide-binding protein
VDNIPVRLLPKLLELTDSESGGMRKLALVLDLRQREFAPGQSSVSEALENLGSSAEILFLDADDDTLLRRYSETRRQHPLAREGNILGGVARERELLESVKAKADYVLDTSPMTTHDLKRELEKIYSGRESGALAITIMSFGFGKGAPREADMIMDVRFLPNPYFVESLKEKDGRDPMVSEWVLSHDVTRDFLARLDDLILFLLPLYIKEGKKYLTISLGCTGGRHRSVAIAERLGSLLLERGYSNVKTRHRELPP